MQKLQSSHRCITQSKCRAAQTIHWPGLSNDISQLIEACQQFQELWLSLPNKPLLSDPLPDFVFQSVSADLFQTGSLHAMVYLDRLSGWTVFNQWRHSPTSKDVIQVVIRNFMKLVAPIRFRSDGGPQFAAKEFLRHAGPWGVRVVPLALQTP